MIIFITGKANSGKTTLAKRLRCQYPLFLKDVVILDGDNVRKHFPTGFSDEEREEHIMRIAKFAALLEEQDKTVIIALVAPRKEWRQKARALFNKSELIYVTGGTLWKGTTYEEPDQEENPAIVEGNKK